MASQNSFDNQVPALFDRHPQSPPAPVASSPNFLAANSPSLVFAHSAVPTSLRNSLNDRQTPSPTLSPHQHPLGFSNSACMVTTTTVAAVLRSSPSNAPSPTCLLIDGQPHSMDSIQSLISHLRDEIALRDAQIARLTDEVENLRRRVGDRNRDVDQLRSVLDQKYIPLSMNDATNHSSNTNNSNNVVSNEEVVMEMVDTGGPSISSLTPAHNNVGAPPARVKKQGVCGESISRNADVGFIHYEKDLNSRSLIYNAITSNEFLNNLDQSQIEEIVLCMYEKRVDKGCYIIREGEPGDALYVTAEGLLQVSKGDQVIGQMEVGQAFGEMALLYNCNRTASVKALTNAKFWKLDRRVYQQIMMNSSVHKHKKNFQFLLSVSDFKNLSQRKLHKLADVLELIFYPGNEYIIRQGEVGETFFIIHSGQVKVTQSKQPGEPPQEIRILGPGNWFGERALYKREKRSANVVAMPPGVHVLCLDRSNFIHLIGDLSEIKSREYADSNPNLLGQSPATDVEDFAAGGLGEKRASMTSQTSIDDSASCSSATAAVPVGLVRSGSGASGPRSPFFPAAAVPTAGTKRSTDLAAAATSVGALMHSAAADTAAVDTDMSIGNVRASVGRQRIKFEDLVPVAILGIGGFGRVELVGEGRESELILRPRSKTVIQLYLNPELVQDVVLKNDPSKSFALKCMKKKHIVETRQEKHIFSERNLMFEIQSQFVCRLYATYRDNKYVYMLLEACLGGEIWTVLRNRGNFDDNITRFIVASVLEAFTYLHTKHIIYRDLKPENLLLDERGYIKLCDFGFAKKISPGKKTWTFCGTPEYVAPEIILNKGHDHSADYWSLGILMFELLTGSPPFTGMDPMKIYNIILHGIDAIMFPPFLINRTATALIHRLCAQNPVERLGYGRGGIVDIKQHKYFQGFDWIGLCRGTLQAPIQPRITGPTDVSNFDHYPEQTDIPPDELSGWDVDF